MTENMLKPKSKITPYTVIAPIIVLALFCTAWFSLTSISASYGFLYLSDPVDGISYADDVDFDENIARISREMDFYPWHLYTSEDFAQGNVIEAQNRSDVFEANKIPYGTHRTQIKLQPNTYYSIVGYSIDYGTKVFVNGQEVTNVGVVSDDPAIAVPRVNFMEFPAYTDDDGMLELIMQYSNYAHNEGGSTPILTISTPENINRAVLDTGFFSYVMSGGLLLLAGYYFLDGLIRRKRIGLQLALCCLIFALRDQWFYIVSLVPWEYDWYLHYRIIVLITAITPLAILLLIESLYPKAAKRWITFAFIALSIAGMIIMFTVPTTEVVGVSNKVELIAIPYAIYLLYSIIRYYIKRKNFAMQDVYTFIGIAVLLIAASLDGWLNDIIPIVTRTGYTPLGMLLFVMIFMSVLATQSMEDELALAVSNKEKEMLEKINEMKTDFLQKMAHEIKTPLTVMSGYAQLTNMQINSDQVNDETIDNLTIISAEAKRLSTLVSNLLEMPNKPLSEAVFSELSLKELLHYSGIVCRAILEKNNNTFIATYSQDFIIRANMEMLMQVILNMAFNSNKHMEGGQFSITAQQEDAQNLALYIADSGSGIDPKNAQLIFEKGYSTNNTKGLGLSICKEIIDIHKGTIELMEHEGAGALFKITLPLGAD